MFRKIVRWLDALWWETTIITKIKTTHRQFKTPEPERTGFRKLTNGYSPQEIKIPHHGAEVVMRVPENVRKRPTMMRDGMLDYTVFPTYRHTPLIISYTKNDHKFVSCDGIPLSRSNEIKGWTKRKAVYTITKHANLVTRLPPELHHVTGRTSEMMLLHLHRSWLYMSYQREDGGLIQMYQPNVGQFNHESETLEMAFGYARALLITLGQVREPVDVKDEQDLAILVMSLLLENLTNR